MGTPPPSAQDCVCLPRQFIAPGFAPSQAQTPQWALGVEKDQAVRADTLEPAGTGVLSGEIEGAGCRDDPILRLGGQRQLHLRAPALPTQKKQGSSLSPLRLLPGAGSSGCRRRHSCRPRPAVQSRQDSALRLQLAPGGQILPVPGSYREVRIHRCGLAAVAQPRRAGVLPAPQSRRVSAAVAWAGLLQQGELPIQLRRSRAPTGSVECAVPASFPAAARMIAAATAITVTDLCNSGHRRFSLPPPSMPQSFQTDTYSGMDSGQSTHSGLCGTSWAWIPEHPGTSCCSPILSWVCVRPRFLTWPQDRDSIHSAKEWRDGRTHVGCTRPDKVNRSGTPGQPQSSQKQHTGLQHFPLLWTLPLLP